MRRFERNGQNESETCCDGVGERGDALLALRQMLAGFQLCGHYAIRPPETQCPPPLGALPHPLGPNPRHFAVLRVYSPDMKVYTLHCLESILSIGRSVYSFGCEVYTLSGAKCIHFYKGRVYTFAQKCRGLCPRVSGVVPESVGGCAQECRANCLERKLSACIRKAICLCLW